MSSLLDTYKGKLTEPLDFNAYFEIVKKTITMRMDPTELVSRSPLSSAAAAAAALDAELPHVSSSASVPSRNLALLAGIQVAVQNYLDSLSLSQTSASQEPESPLQSSSRFFPNPETRNVTARDHTKFYRDLLNEYKENQLGAQLLLLALLNTENPMTIDLKASIAKACFPQLFVAEGLIKLRETLQQSIIKPDEELMSRLSQATRALDHREVTAIISSIDQRPGLKL